MGGRALVYGGSGALGREVVSFFKARQWWVCVADLTENPAADCSVIITETQDLSKQSEQVMEKFSECSKAGEVDAILCVAGGFGMGGVKSPELMSSADLMWKQSVWSSLISSQIAAKFLKKGGLLQLTGAMPCLGPTPALLGYGMAKAAVHQLTKSLSKSSSGLPEDSCVLAILPRTLDTPMNRKAMPSADFATWTPLSFVAEQLFQWASEPSSRHASGSLVKVVTTAGRTELLPA